MRPGSSFSHCVTALVDASAHQAFEYLADPLALGEWSIGCMNTEPTEETGVYTGRSLFNNAQTWFAIDSRPELMVVDYHTGTPGSLVPRISARVIPARVCDLAENQCYVSLTAWRTSGMTADRWQALCTAHEVEIWLIKTNIERRAGTAISQSPEETWF